MKGRVMSDEKKINPVNPNKVPVPTKGQIDLWVRRALDLISTNHSKNEIIETLIEECGVSRSQAARYYTKAMTSIAENNADRVKCIRDRRIASLQRDIKEAYQNYVKELHPPTKVHWWKEYQSCKNQLDMYFANGLKPEAEQAESRIEISFSGINNLPNEGG
jgi:AraC-like DNA-binding protein